MAVAVASVDQLQWRFAVSSTLRGIYVIRYFLFSGGCAILGALIERAAVGADRSLAGLLIGLGGGLVIFRGQLRPLFWPSLALGQESLYLIRRGRAAVVQWASIDQIAAEKKVVCLRLIGSTTKPESAQTIRLDPRKLGTSFDSLLKQLVALAADPQRRLQLPTDEQLRRALAIPPPEA